MSKSRKVLSAAIAGVLLSAFSATASAQAVPGNTANAPDGALLFAAFDGARSVVQWLNPFTYLGSDRADLGAATSTIAANPAGFSTQASVDLTGFNASTTRWLVASYDNSGATGLNITFSNGITQVDPVTGVGPTNLGAQTQNFANILNEYVRIYFNEGGFCAGLTVCQATNADAAYFSSGQGAFPFTLTGGVGDSLNFFELRQSTLTPSNATLQRFDDVNGSGGTRIATWTLASLTGANNVGFNMPAAGGSTEIPLPAAAWLLLSGLAGLGVVRRRREQDV